MAVLQRLFQNRRNARQYNRSYYCQEESSTGIHLQPELDRSRIRLLIIADNEKGRVTYFDSNAIHKSDDKSQNQRKAGKTSARLVPGSRSPKDQNPEQPNITGKNGEKYQFQRLGSDVKLLEEMMFGAVAMAYKGSTLKVHHIRIPPQLVVTKVFYPQKPKPDSAGMEGDCDLQSGSLCSSYDQLGEGLQIPTRRTRNSHVVSIPVDVPVLRENLTDSTDEDSGLYSLTSSGSFQSLFPSPSSGSANSYNSLHRRWMRSQSTSLQRRWDSQEKLNSIETSQIPKKRQIKLAIGILFSTSDGKNVDEEKDSEEYRVFQSFFFAHVALIEGHVEVLRGSVERAIFTGHNMVPSIFEALDVFRDAMYDLYMAPRLMEPVWLTMMSNIRGRYALCERFVHEFMSLVAKYDNKSTKFFVSTLLSAVLTYHLAWVATVTPGDGTPSKTYLDKHSAKWLDTLAKTHPYNPLWAQLGDLYGAIGNPLRVARTVVVGRKAELVKKFLYVLSYFIRCSDVHEEPFTNCISSILETHCWENPAPSRAVSVDDGGVSTVVDEASGELESFSLAEDISGSAGLCCRCSSCPSAFHWRSATQNKKVENVKNVVSPVDVITCKCQRTKARLTTEVQCYCDKYKSQCQCLSKNIEDRRQCSEVSVAHEHRHGETQLQSAFSSSNVTGEMAGGDSDDVCIGKKLNNSSKELIASTVNEVGSDSGIECSNSYDKSVEGVECKLAGVHIVEVSPMENVQHVRRSAEKGPAALSVLSRQLAADEEALALEKKKAKLKDAQNLFLSGGSNSMFEEYYEGDAEVKTIDDVSENQLVIQHPLARSCTSSPSLSTLGLRGAVVEEGAAQQQHQSRLNSVSRQSSADAKPHVSKPAVFNPARCRSVTPTELERRRHLSSTSSIDLDMFDPFFHCLEVAMPVTSIVKPEEVEDHQNFGRSLLGSYSDHYMSDFVLHGTSDNAFRPKLLQDLQSTLQHSSLDEPVAESVCIIADTDSWTVEVANSRLLEMSSTGTMPWTTSHLVATLIESVLDLHRLKMSAEFCIMHMEDRLQEMYFKSLMLAEYIKGVKSPSQQQLSQMLGFDASDLPLLLSIAGTHTPNLALGSEAKVRSSNTL